MNYFSTYISPPRDFDAAALSSKYSAKDCKKTPTHFTQLLIILQHMCALEGAIKQSQDFRKTLFVDILQSLALWAQCSSKQASKSVGGDMYWNNSLSLHPSRFKFNCCIICAMCLVCMTTLVKYKYWSTLIRIQIFEKCLTQPIIVFRIYVQTNRFR